MYAVVITVGLCLILIGSIAACIRRITSKEARLGRLISKYQDTKVATRIFQRQVWQGQTEQQLLDSRGEPERIQRTLTDPHCEIWNYAPRGLSRHGLRITLKNGLVASWD